MVKDLKTKAARVVSFMLHPQFIFPLVLLMPFLKEEQLEGYFSTLLVSFILPFVYFLHLFLTKKISDWDIKDRRERYRIYAMTLLGLVLGLAYLKISSTEWIFSEFLKFFWISVCLVLLNFINKVSIHTACVSLFCILGIVYFSWSLFVLLLIPLVAFSRLLLKRHQLSEVVLGALLPSLYIFI